MKVQLIRSNAFLPINIQLWMVLWWLFENIRRMFTSLPFVKFHWPYNHVSVTIGDSEWEAVGKGVVRHGYGVFGHMFAKEWDIPTNKETEVRFYLTQQERKPYEVGNFWWHILKVFTGRWWGAWNDNKHSCVELGARALQVAGYQQVSKYVNPFELYEFLVKNFGPGKVVKTQKGFINKLFYWSVPVMKAAATFIVLYLTYKGLIFTELKDIKWF